MLRGLRVAEAVAVAREWVHTHGHLTPGFAGAYLTGSALWLDGNAPFPETSDVDVHLVLHEGANQIKPGKFIYQGVLLEISYIAQETLSSPEAVLASYHTAGAFRRSGILADPTGALGALQRVVEREYAQARWVQARCDAAMDNGRRFASGLNPEMPLHDQVTVCSFAAGAMPHLLLVAGLRNPTVRKRYAAARDLLAEHGRLDEHERLLEQHGSAGMTRARVEQHLDWMTRFFDVAAGAIRTPYRFGSDISAVARPISVDGSIELIQQGLHRETVFWIVATASRCRHILAADAPDHLAQLDPHYRALMEDLGLSSYADRQRRCAAVVAYLPHVRQVADEIITRTPEIQPGT